MHLSYKHYSKLRVFNGFLLGTLLDAKPPVGRLVVNNVCLQRWQHPLAREEQIPTATGHGISTRILGRMTKYSWYTSAADDPIFKQQSRLLVIQGSDRAWLRATSSHLDGMKAALLDRRGQMHFEAQRPSIVKTTEEPSRTMATEASGRSSGLSSGSRATKGATVATCRPNVIQFGSYTSVNL